MKKVIFFLLTALVVSGVLVVNSALSHQKEQDLKDSRHLNTLYSEYSHSENTIRHNEVKIKQLLKSEAGVFIVFDQLSDNTVKIAKPLLDNYEYTAILLLTPSRMPGDEGCLSTEQFLSLVESGWEVGIGFEDDFVFSSQNDRAVSQLEDHINQVLSHPVIKNNQISMSTVSFKQYYIKEFDDTVKSFGIHTLLCTQNESFTTDEYFTSENELLKIDSMNFNMHHTIQSSLTNKLFNLSPTAIVIKQIQTSPKEDDNVSLEKMHNMLQYLSEYNLHPLHTSSLQSYYEKLVSSFVANKTAIEESLQVIDREKENLVMIQQQIDEIFNSANNGKRNEEQP